MKNKKQRNILFIVLLVVLIAIIVIPTLNNELKFSKLVNEANVCFDSKNYKHASEVYDDALSLSPIFKDTESIRSKSSKAKILNESMDNFNKGMDSYKNKDYESVVYFLSKIPREDIQNYNEAIKKLKESKPLYNNKIMEKAKKAAENNDFYKALITIDEGLKYDNNNSELISLKNKYEKQNSDLETARMEAKAKAEEAKKEAEARVEAEKYKTKKITSSDNYNVWSVYLKAGEKTFKINAKDGEEDNVIVKLGDHIVINEIGIGTYANSVEVPSDGWYNLSVECSMGYSWNFQ
ncbi:tetratricopeptide repeat protein [Clostridium sporogenes]|uniref:tetratricopeptide repeat protein n=1 Tax=Clostridium sporogenes TaxID=1509 RepID=UPI003DA62CC7